MLVAEKIYGADHYLVSENYEVLPLPQNTVLIQKIDYATAEASLCEEECFQSALDNQDVEELRWCYEFFYGLELSGDDLIRYHNRRQHYAKVAPKNECAGLLPPAPEELPTRLERVKKEIRSEIQKCSEQISGADKLTPAHMVQVAFMETLSILKNAENLHGTDCKWAEVEKDLAIKIKQMSNLMQGLKKSDFFDNIEGHRNGLVFALAIVENA